MPIRAWVCKGLPKLAARLWDIEADDVLARASLLHTLRRSKLDSVECVKDSDTTRLGYAIKTARKISNYTRQAIRDNNYGHSRSAWNTCKA